MKWFILILHLADPSGETIYHTRYITAVDMMDCQQAAYSIPTPGLKIQHAECKQR